MMPPPTLLPHRHAWDKRVDPRLPAYLVAGFGAMLAALFFGQPFLAALGAPFLGLAALGLVDNPPARPTGSITLSATGVMEEDVVEGEIHLDWDETIELDAILTGWRGVRPVEPSPELGWSLAPGTGPARFSFAIEARTWGVHSLGCLWVRYRRPGAFAFREEKVALAPDLRVFPTPVRLKDLLRPAEPRVVLGAHRTRARGHGTDFAELRAYQPGDRLRDVSWSASARLGEPWVRVNHPERTGTVVILLDASFGNGVQSRRSLALAARAAWAVATVHLRAQDRVGFLAQGRTTAWVPPRGGPRARWMLIRELLDVGGVAEESRPDRLPTTRYWVPGDALIVGVTSLRSQVFPIDLLRFKRKGHTTVALIVDPPFNPGRGKTPETEAATRIWTTQRETARRRLARGGIPSALIRDTDGVPAAMVTVSRRLDASRNRRFMEGSSR